MDDATEPQIGPGGVSCVATSHGAGGRKRGRRGIYVQGPTEYAKGSAKRQNLEGGDLPGPTGGFLRNPEAG